MGFDEVALEAGVERPVGGVAFGVRGVGVPSVEVNGRVVGLGRVHDIVPEDPRVMDDEILEPRPSIGVRACISPGPP